MAKLFFSYTHKDESLRNELEIHLTLLKRQGVISAWHDRRINAGSEIDQEIDKEIESSEIILLLVSAHFLASDYCFEREMHRAMEKHNNKESVVIPVILHPCDWHSAPFGKLLATPTDGKPVSMHANQQEALTIIAKDVRKVAEQFTKAREVVPVYEQNTSLESKPYKEVARSSNLRVKKKFDDHERDLFLDESYRYVARYFESSLHELEKRNTEIKTRFKQTSETSFSSFIYINGARAAQCSIWFGGDNFGSSGIAYSSSEGNNRNSYNNSLNVVDDGYTLQLRSLGFQFSGKEANEYLTMQGAAEHYWSVFIEPLQ